MGKRLRFVFRNFPLTQAHPHAEHAAEMAEAAGSKGKFWEMHALLFQNQRALDDQHLLEYAAKAGIDPAFAASALTAHSFADKVKQDFRSGVRSGVNGTPTFYVNGERYDGSADAESMIEALEDAIGDKP